MDTRPTARRGGLLGALTRNFDGYLEAASKQKWLEVHGEAHWTHFYTDYGVALQKRFLGRFLKGEDTGWDKQPPVLLQVRHVDRFVAREEQEWPLARTQWTKFYPQPDGRTLSRQEPAAAAQFTYEALGDNSLFLTGPLREEIEITGPIAAKLFLSSSTRDADVFLALRVFDPNGKEVTFQGSNDPRTPVGLGWLRASHRKLDPARTLPYRPYHTHDEVWPLVPDKPVELDVEIWPTCIVVPAGYRIGLAVRGKDYHCDGPGLAVPGAKYSLTGVGPFLHERPEDRPDEIFGGKNTLHFAAGKMPYVLLPVIPTWAVTRP
jgi:predicted acyl esterase